LMISLIYRRRAFRNQGSTMPCQNFFFQNLKSSKSP
jgi:hypothetical protein